MKHYTAAFFRILDTGGIVHPSEAKDTASVERGYMNVYSLCGYNLNLNMLVYTKHMAAFKVFNFINNQVEWHSYKDFAKYTDLFTDSSWPAVGCWPTRDERCHNIHLGFIFENPADAALFKLACPFEIHVIEFPESCVFK